MIHSDWMWMPNIWIVRERERRRENKRSAREKKDEDHWGTIGTFNGNGIKWNNFHLLWIFPSIFSFHFIPLYITWSTTNQIWMIQTYTHPHTHTQAHRFSSIHIIFWKRIEILFFLFWPSQFDSYIIMKFFFFLINYFSFFYNNNKKNLSDTRQMDNEMK